MKVTRVSPFVLLILALSVVRFGAAQPVQARPRITGINHIAFRVTDAKAARRFYSEILGLSEYPSADGVPLAYAVGSHQRVIVEPGLPAGEDERLSHLAFETPDVKALGAHLSALGFAVTQPKERCDPSAIRVVDPDGHPIEFVEAPWPPPPSAAPGGSALSKRLLHAGLTVRDEQNAHRFYRDALGFSEIWRGGRPEGVTQWINMRVPDGTDYLEYMLSATPPDRQRRGSMHHVCLMVPDIQTAWEEVGRRNTGSTVRLSPPNVGVNGRWQLNLYDPDGTRTELMEPFRVR